MKAAFFLVLSILLIQVSYADDGDKLKAPFETGKSFVFKKSLSLRKSNFEDVKPPTKAKMLYFVDGKAYQYYTNSKIKDALYLELETGKEIKIEEFEKIKANRSYCYLTIPTEKEDGIKLNDKTDAYFTYHYGEVYSVSRDEKQFTANIKIQDVKDPARFVCTAWSKGALNEFKTVGDVRKIVEGYIDFKEPTNKQVTARAIELMDRLKETSKSPQSNESAQSDTKEKKIPSDQPGPQSNPGGAKSAK